MMVALQSGVVPIEETHVNNTQAAIDWKRSTGDKRSWTGAVL